LSVNRIFLYTIHSLQLTLGSGLKKWLYDGRGVGVKAISAGFLLKIDMEKVSPRPVTGSKYSSLGHRLAAGTPPVQPARRPALLPA
jgi:hypothetical protein